MSASSSARFVTNASTKLSVAMGREASTEDLIRDWKSNSLKLNYMSGMQQEFWTEAEKGACPIGQNTPQRCPMGLYAEQVSGTSFTTPRVKNMRSWLYRILPSVKQSVFKKVPSPHLISDFAGSHGRVTPMRMRWNPLDMSGIIKGDSKMNWREGLKTICGAGSPEAKSGMVTHVYTCNESMINESFCNSDGDLLIVPCENPSECSKYSGELLIRTELGAMTVAPGEFCVIQRGIPFSVHVQGPSRGYVAEVFDSHFVIPDLGPIGANGLANPRDFMTVTACYENSFENEDKPFYVYQKFLGNVFKAVKKGHSVFNVVGWHGNYAPFKYDLDRYCAINSVTFDHIDPSIFTVLTAPTNEPGVAACDFVVFPPRWSVHTSTFRPPYYHRNCMSEYMGNVKGVYEAKRKGFLPGGGSLHSCMVPHGPDAQTFEIASKENQVPIPPKTSAMAFMFESSYIFKLTEFALDKDLVQDDYFECWQPLQKHFKKGSPQSKL